MTRRVFSPGKKVRLRSEYVFKRVRLRSIRFDREFSIKKDLLRLRVRFLVETPGLSEKNDDALFPVERVFTVPVPHGETGGGSVWIIWMQHFR